MEYIGNGQYDPHLLSKTRRAFMRLKLMADKAGQAKENIEKTLTEFIAEDKRIREKYETRH